MSGELVALNSNWLDTQTVANVTNACITTGDYVPIQTTLTIGGTYYWPYQQWSYPVYVSSPSRPIKLTLSEIERLRKAARADKALKSILSKFTDQIEITVDFE